MAMPSHCEPSAICKPQNPSLSSAPLYIAYFKVRRWDHNHFFADYFITPNG